MFTKETIKTVSLELTSLCNLDCTACDRKIPGMTNTKYKHLDKDILLKFIDTLPNLQNVEMIGGISEPTLYNMFIPLIQEIKKRNKKIIISSNGSTHLSSKTDSHFWLELARVLTKDDVITMCIDGHTQEIHQKYRINSKLDTVIKNVKTLTNNSECVVRGLHLLFDFNYRVQKETKEFILKYCDEYEPRLGNTTFHPNTKAIEKYSIPRGLVLFANTRAKERLKPKQIDCECPSKQFSEVYINVDGTVHPCCIYNNKAKRNKTLWNSDSQTIIDNLNRVVSKVHKFKCCKESCLRQITILENHYQKRFYKDFNFKWETITQH